MYVAIMLMVKQLAGLNIVKCS